LKESVRERQEIMKKVRKERAEWSKEINGLPLSSFERGARSALGILLDWLERRDQRGMKK
jgi:hypothetical protein